VEALDPKALPAERPVDKCIIAAERT
jgi:hypothetical protein